MEIWIGTGIRLSAGLPVPVDIASATAKAMIGVRIKHVLKDGEDIKAATSTAKQKAVVKYNEIATAKGVAQLDVEGLRCEQPEPPNLFEELLKSARSAPNQCTVSDVML